jgi:hypothetical protein
MSAAPLRFPLKSILRVGSIAFLCLAITGCRQKEKSIAVQPAVTLATPRKSVAAPPPQSSRIQTPVNYESDPLYQQAQGLSHSDIRKAMDQLETAIAKAPDNPQSAPYYLFLGKLKKQFEDCQGNYAASSLENPEKQCPGFLEYAKARPEEYRYNEVGGNYLYSGSHFQEAEKRFPASALAVDAAYANTKLSQGGECEGFLDCYVENGFAPVREFLTRYPDSPHTAEAVKRADDAFRKNLWGEVWKTEWTEIKDPNKASDYYEPANLKRMVQEYEDLAEKLPVRFRASAWETVAYYRGRFGKRDRAKSLYQRILKENPDYKNNAEIRKQLAMLQ